MDQLSPYRSPLESSRALSAFAGAARDKQQPRTNHSQGQTTGKDKPQPSPLACAGVSCVSLWLQRGFGVGRVSSPDPAAPYPAPPACSTQEARKCFRSPSIQSPRKCRELRLAGRAVSRLCGLAAHGAASPLPPNSVPAVTEPRPPPLRLPGHCSGAQPGHGRWHSASAPRTHRRGFAPSRFPHGRRLCQETSRSPK